MYADYVYCVHRTTERRITFQRYDFVRFDRDNATVLGVIDHIMFHKLSEQRYLFAIARAIALGATVDEITGAKIVTLSATTRNPW